MGAEANLVERNITLPEAPTPVANYVSAKQVGNLLYLSGHGPMVDGEYIAGKVGAELDIAAAQNAARQTGLNLLATTRRVLGSLDRVRNVVKALGMVNAVPDFKDHPTVINGFSDLMVEVFGEEIGKHARSAVGMGSLPGQIAVEIEVILEIDP
jgi:enamine deaminase RidA (YjgF/YER057c/UK114 family)